MCSFDGASERVRKNDKLTPREMAVAGLVAEGFDGPMIAKELGIKSGTVKNYVHKVYCKLDFPASDDWHGDELRIKLAVLWNCELFQIGLRELGLTA
jgi:DNA-binding NarL/FixJ family response regulator